MGQEAKDTGWCTVNFSWILIFISFKHWGGLKQNMQRHYSMSIFGCVQGSTRQVDLVRPALSRVLDVTSSGPA